MSGALNVGEVTADWSIGSHAANGHIGDTSNDCEQIVEVVRDPARELSDRFHLLRLTQLRLEFTTRIFGADTFGHVDKCHHDLQNPTLLTAHRVRIAYRPGDVRATWNLHANHKAIYRTASGYDAIHREIFRAHRHPIFTNECPCGIDSRLAAHLIKRQPEQRTGHRIAIDDRRIAGVHDHTSRQATEQRS